MIPISKRSSSSQRFVALTSRINHTTSTRSSPFISRWRPTRISRNLRKCRRRTCTISRSERRRSEGLLCSRLSRHERIGNQVANPSDLFILSSRGSRSSQGSQGSQDKRRCKTKGGESVLNQVVKGRKRRRSFGIHKNSSGITKSTRYQRA